MQNNQKIIAIFGAGGFIGKHLMRELTKLDYRIKVATRSPYLKGYLKTQGNPGQIELFQTNIFDLDSIKEVLNNCNFVINLVGILYETRKQKFDAVHSYFPDLLSKACSELGIEKLIHVSALGIKEKHPSKYMQSKLEGENKIRENFLSASLSENETLEVIKKAYEKFSVVLDPHTAIGYGAFDKHNLKGNNIVLATAHPCKFPDAVSKAINLKSDLPKELEFILNEKEDYDIIDNNLEKIKKYIIGKIK